MMMIHIDCATVLVLVLLVLLVLFVLVLFVLFVLLVLLFAFIPVRIHWIVVHIIRVEILFRFCLVICAHVLHLNIFGVVKNAGVKVIWVLFCVAWVAAATTAIICAIF